MDLSTIMNTFTPAEQATLMAARDILMQGANAQVPFDPEFMAMAQAYHKLAQVIGYAADAE
jgi:hypothetical protein